jgi:hypothetical protein
MALFLSRKSLNRYSLITLYKDDLADEEIKAVHVRLAATCLLGPPQQFERMDQRTTSIRHPSLGKPAHPDIFN